MKKLIIFIFINLILLTYSNTIVIDGTNDFIESQKFTASDGKFIYITSDKDYLYIGFESENMKATKKAFYIVIDETYYDNNDGFNELPYAINLEGSKVTLPFKATKLFYFVKNGVFPDEYRSVYSGGNWTRSDGSDKDYMHSYLKSSYSEYSIKLSELGNPNKLKLMIYAKDLSSNNGWGWFFGCLDNTVPQGQGDKVISNYYLSYTIEKPWIQTNWIGGENQDNFEDETKFKSQSNIYFNKNGETSLERDAQIHMRNADRIKQITVDNNQGVGILATDGTYIYSKSWSSYDGNDRNIAKIGTGYNGTVEGQYYEDMGVVGSSLSMCFLNGYIYNGYTNASGQLQRMHPTTKVIDYVTIPDKLIARNNGANINGTSSNFLITSYKNYLYNVAYTSTTGGYNGFTVKIFDANDNFAKVSEFTSGTTSFYTDGIICDGRIIYMIEWSGQHRVRAIDLNSYGQIYQEVSDQNTGGNNMINGQYDYINNVTYVGDLIAQYIYKFPGITYHTNGELISSIFSVENESKFQRVLLNYTLKTDTLVKIQVRTGDSEVNLNNATWKGPDGTNSTYYTSTENILSNLSNGNYVQYKALLETADNEKTPILNEIATYYYKSTNNEPSNFSLSSPNTNSELNNLTVNFNWNDSTDPDGTSIKYDLWYGTDSTFSNKTIISDITNSESSVILTDNTKYYWKVIAIDVFGAVKESNETDYYFYTNLNNENPTIPTIIEPVNNGYFVNLTPTIKISNSSDNDPNDSVVYVFQLASDENFNTILETSNDISEDISGTTSYQLTYNSLKYKQDYWIRVKSKDNNGGESNYTTHKFKIDNGWLQTNWSGGNSQLNWLDESKFNSYTNLDISTVGEVKLDRNSIIQTRASDRIKRITVDNNQGVGVLATDGTYIYSKSWSSYDGNDRVIAKIGTGYNNTIEGKYYSDLATVGSSLSMCYLNGYIYNGYTNGSGDLERINPTTGAVDYIAIPDKLMVRNTGVNVTGTSSNVLITSDEKYLYSIAYTINNGGYNGFTIKIFDPNDNFSKVREFTSGTTSFYADGVFSDGNVLYMIEWGGQYRVRAIDIATGNQLYQEVSDQATGGNSMINGQYDYINNVTYIGDLLAQYIYKYPGVKYETNGELESSIFDTGGASNFSQISWTVDKKENSDVKFYVRSSNDNNNMGTYTGPYSTNGENLNISLNNNRYVQYKTEITTTDTSVTSILNDILITLFPVGENPPGSFDITTPVVDAIISTKRPTLNWSVSTDPDIGDSVKYDLWLSLYPEFDNKTEYNEIVNTNYTFASDLTEDKLYYWKVRAVDSYGAAIWSTNSGRFYVNSNNQTPTAPSLLDPADNTITLKLTPDLIVINGTDNDAGDILKYHFQIFDNENLNGSPVFEIENVDQGSSNTTTTNVSTHLIFEKYYYWRVRVKDFVGTNSVWSQTFKFQALNGWIQQNWEDGNGQEQWSNEKKFDSFTDIYYKKNGSLRLARSENLRMRAADRIKRITVDNNQGVAVLATDGTYIYSKSWSSYDGNDNNIAKIGTGYNNTVEGKYYSDVANVSSSLSICYINGYLYNGATDANGDLQRINTTTGAVDYVSIPDSLITRNSGAQILNASSNILITSDENYLYNVAYTINNGGYNGFTVKVFDPNNNFVKVKEFTSGNSSFYTDGILSDGKVIYMIEWGGQHRIRAIDLDDYSQVYQEVCDQATGGNSMINGQYDYINNVTYLGDLLTQYIYKYPGIKYGNSGNLTSSIYTPGDRSKYQKMRLNFDKTSDTDVKVQIRTSDTINNIKLTNFIGPDGTDSSYYKLTEENVTNFGSGEFVQYKVYLESTDVDKTPLFNSFGLTHYPATNNLPNDFSLISPANSSENVNLNLSFNWQNQGDPDGDPLYYDINYGFDPTFSEKLEEKGITTNNNTILLQDNKKYYWKVLAYDKFGAIKESNETNWYLFTNSINELPTAPTITQPLNNGYFVNLAPKFIVENSVDNDPNDTLTYKFQVSDIVDFSNVIIDSGEINEGTNQTEYTVNSNNLKYKQDYWLRVRAKDDKNGESNYSTHKFKIDNGWIQSDWVGGENQNIWSDTTKFASQTDIKYSKAGQISIGRASDLHMRSIDRIKRITVDNNQGVGVLATDGTYIYSKSWGSYDGNDRVIAKIGTGYNNTIEGKYYSDLATVSNSLSICYLKGYLYNGYTNGSGHIQRVNVNTGAIDYVEIPDGLMLRNTAATILNSSGAIIVTADENYLYNVSYSINNGGYNGYTIKVFDPDNNFAKIDEFTSGNSSFYTDGVVCDGKVIYMIEWGGQHRVRAIDLTTHNQVYQEVCDQATGGNNMINGQYDFVNNVCYIGDLLAQYIYKYKGFTYETEGELISSVFDTGGASNFSQLSWTLEKNDDSSFEFYVRTSDDPNSMGSYQGPYTENGSQLGGVLNNKRYVQYKVILKTTDTSYTPILKDTLITLFPVGENPPSSFSLISPNNGEQVTTLKPTFTWGISTDPDVGDSVKYDLWISEFPEFDTKTEYKEIIPTNYTLLADLIEDKQYYWKVKAVDSFGAETNNTSNGNFFTNSINSAPTKPTLISPINNENIYQVNPVLSWNVSTDNDAGTNIIYNVELAEDNGFNNIIHTFELTENSYTVQNVQLLFGATYYWRVKSYDSIVYSLWSDIGSFNVIKDGYWTQSDWIGGAGQTNYSDITKYNVSSNINNSDQGKIYLNRSADLHMRTADRTTTITVDNNQGVGVLATDGTYIYSKSWGSYDGNDNSIAKIGTGYNGTIEGHYYSNLANVSSSLSLCYLNGYLYNGRTNGSGQLERINATTGALDYVTIPSGIISRANANILTGSSNAIILTSDDKYLYNVSYSINNGGYNGYTIKVLDPSDNFSLVNEFTSGNSSFYTDGVVCDGKVNWKKDKDEYEEELALERIFGVRFFNGVMKLTGELENLSILNLGVERSYYDIMDLRAGHSRHLDEKDNLTGIKAYTIGIGFKPKIKEFQLGVDMAYEMKFFGRDDIFKAQSEDDIVLTASVNF